MFKRQRNVYDQHRAVDAPYTIVQGERLSARLASGAALSLIWDIFLCNRIFGGIPLRIPAARVFQIQWPYWTVGIFLFSSDLAIFFFFYHWGYETLISNLFRFVRNLLLAAFVSLIVGSAVTIWYLWFAG
jgi:hypothetical protein